MIIQGITVPEEQFSDYSKGRISYAPRRAAVLIISNATYAGTRTQRAYQHVMQELTQQSIESVSVEFVPNDPRYLRKHINALRHRDDIDLIVSSGSNVETLRFFLDEARESERRGVNIKITIT